MKLLILSVVLVVLLALVDCQNDNDNQGQGVANGENPDFKSRGNPKHQAHGKSKSRGNRRTEEEVQKLKVIQSCKKTTHTWLHFFSRITVRRRIANNKQINRKKR